MSHEHIGVCVIVINDQNQLLLGKRKNGYRAGYYGLPGGQLELKEKLEDAIKRELYEETGLKGNSVSCLGVVRELQETYNYIHFCFTCQEFEGKPILCEPEKCEGWEWYPIDALPSPLLPGHQAALSLCSNHTSSVIDLI